MSKRLLLLIGAALLAHLSFAQTPTTIEVRLPGEVLGTGKARTGLAGRPTATTPEPTRPTQPTRPT